MKFDKSVVIASRSKITESTPLHIATEGGHREVIQLLLEAGASSTDENKSGFTPMHIAAKHGHHRIIEDYAKKGSLRQISKKIGLSALHIAAYYGEEEVLRELSNHVPVHVKSELPSPPNDAICKVRKLN